MSAPMREDLRCVSELVRAIGADLLRGVDGTRRYARPDKRSSMD
jgi:hypothetical protein